MPHERTNTRSRSENQGVLNLVGMSACAVCAVLVLKTECGTVTEQPCRNGWMLEHEKRNLYCECGTKRRGSIP